ncbi:sensor histidine kinase [Croceibacterium ferulae]|uniref:sensor histidine kinase n=1 Tax=Croceibacterium ferulae TaxID=1854641 RepID=UPI001F4D7180|nr:HAMP domain-containing sensor histidine kinase [Croceibacterium ferulae]
MGRLHPRHWLPRSLLGQMLLAVGAALLVAQGISAALQLQAARQRQEARAISTLAFQLVSEPRMEFGQPPRHRDSSRWRRLRIQRTADFPLRRGEQRDPRREAALRAIMAEQGITPAQLLVTTRIWRDDRWVMRQLADDGELQRQDWLDYPFVLAAMRRPGDNHWTVAREPVPQDGSRQIWRLAWQTLLLYVVLVGGLALLLRRITRPLAALTARVESFARSRDPAGQLEPTGPQDMRRLIVAHNAMEARIVALLDEKDVMLGAIGHDLKTPLTALRVRIESVPDTAERARMAATIEDIVRSLDDILSLARVGRPGEEPERTDLAALLDAMVEEYEDMGQPVEMQPSDRLPMMLRGSWLRRALRNLVDNAVRYGGGARVSLERTAGVAIVRVEDDGPGIAEDAQAAMLLPFARGETSRNRATGGAGLGLTLARAIAEQDGGSLHLVNRHVADGTVRGLTAELHLPIR